MKKILIAFLSILVLTACTPTPEKLVPDSDRGFADFSGNITALNGTHYDFGQIDIMGGVVSRTFAFKNDTDTPLQLFRATSSCGCTKGQVIWADGQKSAEFSAKNPLETSLEIPAGQQFSVQIWYDPLFHGPTDLGLRTRSLIFLTSVAPDGQAFQPATDFPGQSIFEISVTGKVIK